MAQRRLLIVLHIETHLAESLRLEPGRSLRKPGV